MPALIEEKILKARRPVARILRPIYCLTKKKSSESKEVLIAFKKALERDCVMINKTNQLARVMSMIVNYFDLKIKNCLIRKFQKKTTPVAKIFDNNKCKLKISINK